MRDRGEKCFHRLTAQDPAGTIGHRSGNHQRQRSGRSSRKRVRDREYRRLCVQSVENGFDRSEDRRRLRAAPCLIEVGLANLIEGDRAECRIIYIGRNGALSPAADRAIRRQIAAGRFRSRPGPQRGARSGAAQIHLVHESREDRDHPPRAERIPDLCGRLSVRREKENRASPIVVALKVLVSMMSAPASR